MNIQIKQAQSFYADYQLLDIDRNRLQRRNKRMRNSFLLLLTQIFLISFFLINQINH